MRCAGDSDRPVGERHANMNLAADTARNLIRAIAKTAKKQPVKRWCKDNAHYGLSIPDKPYIDSKGAVTARLDKFLGAIKWINKKKFLACRKVMADQIFFGNNLD